MYLEDGSEVPSTFPDATSLIKTGLIFLLSLNELLIFRGYSRSPRRKEYNWFSFVGLPGNDFIENPGTL